MFAIAVFCLVVVTTMAAPKRHGMVINGRDTGGMMGRNDTMPEMCCMPSQWEASMVELNSNPLYTLRFAHDDKMMREGFYVTLVGDTSGKVYEQVFMDYLDQIQYSVNMSSSDPRGFSCVRTKLTRHFYGGCRHKDETVTNLRYLGESWHSNKDRDMHTDSWAFKSNNLDFSISLSRNGCIPMLERVKSEADNFNMVFMFNDVSPAIVTKELLTVPAACATVGSAVIG